MDYRGSEVPGTMSANIRADFAGIAVPPPNGPRRTQLGGSQAKMPTRYSSGGVIGFVVRRHEAFFPSRYELDVRYKLYEIIIGQLRAECKRGAVDRMAGSLVADFGLGRAVQILPLPRHGYPANTYAARTTNPLTASVA